MYKPGKLFLLLAFLVNNTLAQSRDEKITQVENGLIPYVPVIGFPSWNIYERMKYYNVQGVSIAVINNFKIEWVKGYGLADTARKIPVNTNTMFSAGSVSKFVAATIALRLVQDGKLHLDSSVNNYLSSWKIAENEYTKKRPVTLRMLLSHTAGTSQSSYFGFVPAKNPLPGIVQILNGDPVAESRPVVVNSEPGKEFRYSGGGIMVAQMAMMDVSKSDFADLADKTIFSPLGMNNSTFRQPLPEKYAAQASWGYSDAPWYKGMPYVYPQQAAAGLYTTPADLAKFLIDIQLSYHNKGKILNQVFTRQMLSPQALVSEGGYKEQIGVGPFLLQLSNNNEQKGIYFNFTGVNAGFVAYVIGNISEGYGAIIMLNTGDDNNGLGNEIRRSIAKTYNWYRFLPDAVKPVKLPDSLIGQYVGRYRKGPDEVVSMAAENGHLVERINDGLIIYCFPVAKDTIVLTDFNVKGTFVRNEQGVVTGLRTAYQDKPMPKMADSEFTPGELFKLKKYKEATQGYRDMHLNEYQLTYLIYGLLNAKKIEQPGIFMLLSLAQELFPDSAIVYARWGNYYLKINDRKSALEKYNKALKLQPDDKELQDKIKALQD